MGLWEPISGFGKQFGPQKVGGRYLVVDFGAVGVNFCIWDLNLSLWELLLFLLGYIYASQY